MRQKEPDDNLKDLLTLVAVSVNGLKNDPLILATY